MSVTATQIDTGTTQIDARLELKRQRQARWELIRNRKGPVRRLTLRRFIRICKLIEAGKPITKACKAEGVTFSIFRLRVSQSPRLQERVRRAEHVRSAVRFETACGSIMDAGNESWMAHAWWLERSHPHLFALRTVNRQEPDAKQIEPEIPSEILERHRQLMLEIARESESQSEQSTK